MISEAPNPNLPKDELDLFNICRGAVPEVFGRELKAVLDNIADPNTEAKTKRRIVLTFEFAPFPDRQGAIVAVTAKAALGANDNSDASGNIFMVRREGHVSAYSRDVRQELLFGKEEKENDGNILPMSGKDASAGK